ncbi:MAG: NAD(P)H-hydrate epimerase, partial [Myxococcota bacterium]
MKRVVSALEMRELDARAIETCAVPGRVLMEVAGRAVAERCTRWLEGKRARIVVVCGVGNNGGDGFVAAKALAAKRHEVAVFVVGDRTRLKTD